jgi:Tfp pilus assembly protein PilF
MKKYADALMMWKRLEALQTELYGDKVITHLYTWKNIGTCYLGIGKSEDARQYFLDCIELVENLKSDHVKPEYKRKD